MKKNSIAKFLYKCRRCGRHIGGIECKAAIADACVLRALSGTRLGVDKDIPLTRLHTCSGYGTGIADLIGYNIVSEDS